MQYSSTVAAAAMLAALFVPGLPPFAEESTPTNRVAVQPTAAPPAVTLAASMAVARAARNSEIITVTVPQVVLPDSVTAQGGTIAIPVLLAVPGLRGTARIDERAVKGRCVVALEPQTVAWLLCTLRDRSIDHVTVVARSTRGGSVTARVTVTG